MMLRLGLLVVLLVVVVVVAGCGGGRRPAALRAVSAVDAAAALTSHLGHDPSFSCALLPTTRGVLAIVRDAAGAARVHALVPRLLRGDRLAVAIEPSTPSWQTVQATRAALDRTVRDPLVINEDSTLFAHHCPRLTIDIVRGHHPSPAERSFIATAEHRYGGLVRPNIVAPARALAG